MSGVSEAEGAHSQASHDDGRRSSSTSPPSLRAQPPASDQTLILDLSEQNFDAAELGQQDEVPHAPVGRLAEELLTLISEFSNMAEADHLRKIRGIFFSRRARPAPVAREV